MKKFLLTFCLLMGYAILHADTATVDGLTWTYRVSNGEAEIYGEIDYVYDEDGVYESGIAAIPMSTSGAITIPSTLGGCPVTSVGFSALYGCERLTSVTIPSSVTSIGECAFDGCSGLTSVTIPSSVTSIGSGAFWGCSGLTSVTIPSSVTSIGTMAFSYCFGMTSFVVANENQTYTAINGLLCSKDGKTLIVCPGGLTTAEIPEGVAEIGDAAFYACTGLTSFVVANGNQAYTAINGLLCSKDGKTLIVCPGGLTTAEIPEGVTEIAGHAFHGCAALTSFRVANEHQSYMAINGLLCSKDGKTLIACPGGVTSVEIPEGVTSIGMSAFGYCDRLTSVTIPSSVTSIEKYAFEGCYSLTSVTFPSSVTSIGEMAFVGSGLFSVYFRGVPPRVGPNAFLLDPLGEINVPGYYPQRYAGAWQKVIDEKGLWCGLQMESYLLDSEGEEASTYPTYQVPVPYRAATFTATAVGEEQVTLKLTANKGYVFAGWYRDNAFTEACESSLADYRNPTYTYNVNLNNLYFAARFVTVDEDIKLDLVGTEEISPKGNDQRAIQLVVDSYSLPKVSVKGLPAGMKFTDKPVMVKGSKREVEYPANTIYGTPTKPGIYTVTVTLTNATVKKAIVKTFDIEVSNLKEDLIPISECYGPYTPGVSYTLEIPEAVGCSVTGLPAGMKWTAKTVTLSGTPTKPGNYTVCFTKTVNKVKYTATATFTVGPYPQLEVILNDPEGGKVTGAGAFAVNQKVTLKATANKEYVFAGWYKDSGFNNPYDSTVEDYRKPSYTYAMDEEDTQLYARFVTKEEEYEYPMAIELVDEVYNVLEDHVQVRAGEEMKPIKVWVASLTLPTAKVTGLPTGMKFDKKTFTISGKPTKPGLYPVTIEATNASKSRTAFTVVTFEVRHFNAHGLHEGEMDAEPRVVDAFTTTSFTLEDWFGDLFDEVAIKSLKLPVGLTYNAKTGEIKGNGKLKSGLYTATLTDKAGQVTSFAIVAELADEDRFIYVDYQSPNAEQEYGYESIVQGAETSWVLWMDIFKYTEGDLSGDAWGDCYFDEAEAKTISIKVSGLPKGLRANFEKEWYEHYADEGDELGEYMGTVYECTLWLEGQTFVAPGDYPVTVTITNSRTGQIEYSTSVIRVLPASAISMTNQKLMFSTDDVGVTDWRVSVDCSINGNSATASYKITCPSGTSGQETIIKSGRIPLMNMYAWGEQRDEHEYIYEFETASSDVYFGVKINGETSEITASVFEYYDGVHLPWVEFQWDGND